MEEEVLHKNIGEGTNNFQAVLDLTKSGLYVIGMQDDVIIWIGYSEVVCTDEDVGMHGTKLAMEFKTIGCGHH